MKPSVLSAALVILCGMPNIHALEVKDVVITGEAVDAANGKPLAVRIYIRAANGSWYFPKSASPTGSAIRYEKRNGNSMEMHTTLSADPFRAELAPGAYTFKIEHGKEYFPEIRQVEVVPNMPKLTFRMRRWIDMASLGWYSGDTHNHRDPADLPNTLLAEDLNVGLPMVDWTTSSTVPPSTSGRGFRGEFGDKPVSIDATHAWFPRNTEYEIFQTDGKNHTLGALLIVNHRTGFEQPVVPLRSVAEKAHAEGGLLDLEKHNWNWSMALPALFNVDLFELGNNHFWETDYGIKNWAVPAPKWMGLNGSGTDSERDWMSYGFQTYYALLNCGFHIRPAAGTANGVHPVPLGFSRVYVHLNGEPFSYEAWMRGLSEGRSFVTTGPMVFEKINGTGPHSSLKPIPPAKDYRLDCVVRSEEPLESLELIVNGHVELSSTPENRKTDIGSYENTATTSLSQTESSWIAWRCIEKRPNGRIRFAHTAPSYVEVPGKPIRPRKVEVEWMIASVKAEIERSRAVAPASLIEDYQSALATYEAMMTNAR